MNELHLESDPFVAFARWLEEARAAQARDVDAMTLATADSRGRPSARVVLLRGFDARGFVFYTNRESRKALDLQQNPFAALALFWPALRRQVRVEGRAEAVSAQESDAYFASRPRGHRLSAWASPQSRPVPGRAFLEQSVRDAEDRFPGEEVPRPPNWGGLRVLPDAFEFWEERRDRLHERLRYDREGSGWRIVRLAP